jgi:hypothetical protein
LKEFQASCPHTKDDRGKTHLTGFRHWPDPKTGVERFEIMCGRCQMTDMGTQAEMMAKYKSLFPHAAGIGGVSTVTDY